MLHHQRTVGHLGSSAHTASEDVSLTHPPGPFGGSDVVVPVAAVAVPMRYWCGARDAVCVACFVGCGCGSEPPPAQDLPCGGPLPGGASRITGEGGMTGDIPATLTYDLYSRPNHPSYFFKTIILNAKGNK